MKDTSEEDNLLSQIKYNKDFKYLCTKRKRKLLTSKRKKLILFRDKYTCLECKSKENLTIDHIIPLSWKGDNSIDNLRTLCFKCNNKKGNT